MNFKLAAANLLISQFFILIFLIFAYCVWFPHSLSEIIGFNKIAQLIIFTNLVLGPFLLIILYKKNKKPLKFDLAILVLLQMTAITYGVFALYQKHPSYAVFTVDRFTLVNGANSEPEKIRFKELKKTIFSKTKLAYAKFPENINDRNELVLSVMTGMGKDLDKRHEYFEPYTNHINAVIQKSIDTKKLFSQAESQNKLRAFLNKYDGLKEDYLYLPLQSASKDVVWVLDKKTAQPIDIIDIDPWL